MDELLAIGEFSARSCLSAKMLRRYAAAGLLVPAAIDAWSGYRYYTPDQLGQARLIRLLRQAQIPLSEIAAFLANPGPAQMHRWEQALGRVSQIFGGADRRPDDDRQRCRRRQ